MLNLKKVAVTGGISSGKSTVCRFFHELGAYVVSADEIVHQLLSPTTTIGQQVISLLGSEIVRGSDLDRKAIADRVFSNPDLLKKLENLLHPAVLDEMKMRYNQVKEDPAYSLFVAEIPLLYESSSEHFYDLVIAVTAPDEICESRSPFSDFEKRKKRQLLPSQKAAKADLIVENKGSLEELKQKI
ncbi:MAG: dephospho-CoA kinase, partial [Chlamydiales bacterium]|nr:dephospho-CoA kinase [Chlamydiales bacterium]